MQSVPSGSKLDLTRASLSRSDRTCASSDGGPGLNLGEQSAGRSMLGTAGREGGIDGRHLGPPMKPRSGAWSSGSAISALTPHTTVVLPMRTRADPSAVAMEPAGMSGRTGDEWGTHRRLQRRLATRGVRVRRV